MVHDNLIDLNLLRSPTNPDPDADKGSHTFTYSFLPHKNNLIQSDVIRESSCLNQKPLLFAGVSCEAAIPLKIQGNGLELSVLKKAEREKVWVVRIIETHGRASSGSIDFNGKIIECDLMEWEDYGEYEKVESSYVVSLNPFEIKTFKIHFEGNNNT